MRDNFQHESILSEFKEQNTVKDLYLPVLLGTNREGRKSEAVAKWLVTEIEKRDNIFSEIDFRIYRSFRIWLLKKNLSKN